MSTNSSVTDERWQKAVDVATEVIDECRVQLMLKFRFLDLALWKMPLEPTRNQTRYPMGTDAKTIYFEPFSVLSRFEEDPTEATRDYLHMILHCIFREPFDEHHKKKDPWWMACDVMIEGIAMEICGTRFECPDDDRRKEIISNIKIGVGNITPCKLYKLCCNAMEAPVTVGGMTITTDTLVEIQSLFERDGHENWPSAASKDTEREPGETEEVAREDEDGDEAEPQHDNSEMQMGNGAKSQAQGNQDGEKSTSSDDEGEGHEESEEAKDASSDVSGTTDTVGDDQSEGQNGSDKSEKQVNDEKSKEEQEWAEISKQIETDLQTFSKEWGDNASSLMASLEVSNRKVYDYTDFLRRFSMLTEDMKINDDEFDYVYYTYGIDLYGNIPLIEPLEYMETKRIRDFVIAIDTSGSVRGDLVKRFVQHTFDILKESEAFGGRTNIHIIQCDAEIQADTKITDLSQIDEYMKEFYVRGFGGTDFRPVFKYIKTLQDRGELQDLQGMVYFTDGLGYFPSSPPEYDVAFVFMDTGDGKLPVVPPWAMRVVMDEEKIEDLKLGER